MLGEAGGSSVRPVSRAHQRASDVKTWSRQKEIERCVVVPPFS